MIQTATSIESKYIVRYLTKNLKIGANEKTVLSALAWAFANTPNENIISNWKKLGTS